MRCPTCHQHVTPFAAWARQFTDAPGECCHCGTRLEPSRRACWWLPLALIGSLVTIPAAVILGDSMLTAAGVNHGNWFQNQPLIGSVTKIAMFATVVPAVYGVFYIGWRTGRYRVDESPRPGDDNAAGDALSPYDLQQLLRAAAEAERAGDLRRAVDKYAAIANYAGGSHPNAELARERERELRSRLAGELDAEPGAAPDPAA